MQSKSSEVLPVEKTARERALRVVAIGGGTGLSTLLKGDPQNREYRKTKGFCLARAGKWEEAFEVLHDLMGEAEARYYMARVLEHQNHTDDSRLQLQLALKKDPSYAPAREFLAELDQPRTTPTTPDENQVVPAGFVQQPQ